MTNRTFGTVGCKGKKQNVSTKNLHSITDRTYQRICKKIAKRVVRNEEEFNWHASQ